jgi:hypothetical protein
MVLAKNFTKRLLNETIDMNYSYTMKINSTNTYKTRQIVAGLEAVELNSVKTFGNVQKVAAEEHELLKMET